MSNQTYRDQKCPIVKKTIELLKGSTDEKLIIFFVKKRKIRNKEEITIKHIKKNRIFTNI